MPMALAIYKVFSSVLFKPLLLAAADYNAQLKKNDFKKKMEFRNSGDTALMVALRTGMVQYKDGIFSGAFSRDISAGLRRIGARFDKRTGTYRIKDSEVPSGVRSEAMTYEVNAKGIHETIVRKLNEIQTNLEPTFEAFEFGAEPTIAAIEAGWKKTAEALEVMPELTEANRKILAEEYSENMKLYVKKFTEEAIHSLREQTEDNARAGYRFDRLATIIQDQNKVSATKAEFLARQETSIFMAKFHERQAAEAGITRYIWRTSRDQRVRDSHRHLEGKVFFYSDPPIVDMATGRRAGPGQDYGCRCVDEPVLDPVAVGT